MGLASFWSSITGPRVREITPPKRNGQNNLDRRPATSSGVRTIRKTPSLEDDAGRELNLVESLLTTNIIEPPPTTNEPSFEEKKSRRRSRGLSLSRSKNEDGLKRRRSIFGGSKDEPKKKDVPEVPTLPTLSAIYSRQAPAPHTLGDVDRPSTAISAIAVPPPAMTKPSTPSYLTAGSDSTRNRFPNSVGEVFELPAELPATTPKTELEVKKNRRRSIGEVLSGKRPKSMAYERLDKPGDTNAPPTPALVATKTIQPPQRSAENVSTATVRSRRNSNASVASKASKMSKRSKRKSWWQRAKGKDDEEELVPPMPSRPPLPSKEVSKDSMKTVKASGPAIVDLSAFPTAPTTKKSKVDDDAASIRTTRSEKVSARLNPKKRPQSTASHIVRRRRKSWWATGSSNPDDTDEDDSNPLPPVPLLIRSNRTTPDSSPTNSDNGRSPSYTAVRGDDIKAPRPLSTSSAKSRTYTPRSAAKSFLVSTTPVSENVRKSVRHSLHTCEDLDSSFENDRGTYCLSAEQQREWEKLKHLMAVMDRRRDVTAKTFGEASVEEMFPATPSNLAAKRDEERKGVKYSNGDALAALEVGVAK